MGPWEAVALSGVFALLFSGAFFLGAYLHHRVSFWHVRSETLERAESVKAELEEQGKESTLRTLTGMGWRPPAPHARPVSSHPGGDPVPSPDDFAEEKAWKEIEKNLSRG